MTNSLAGWMSLALVWICGASASAIGNPPREVGPCTQRVQVQKQIALDPTHGIGKRKNAVETIKDIGLNCWLKTDLRKDGRAPWAARDSLLQIIETLARRARVVEDEEVLRTYYVSEYNGNDSAAYERGWRNDPGRDEILRDAVHVYLDLVSFYPGVKGGVSRYYFVENALSCLDLGKTGHGDCGFLKIVYALKISDPDIVREIVARLEMMKAYESSNSDGLARVSAMLEHSIRDTTAALKGEGQRSSRN